MEDEFDINGQKIVPHRPKKSIFHRAVNSHDGRRIKEPVDPYLLIIENQLDLLRASLKDVIQFEDPYSYSGTASRLDMVALHTAFFRSAVLQIVSARSRPEAFMTQQSMENPDGADPGVVEIKVTKVGLLWRKELKRKKARSPWQEWGAVLTGSQLYFFRNITWIKSLLHQYEQHHKHGFGTPVIFKPALEQFKPDAQISTDDAVALLDKSYKKHKNAFAFVRHGGIQEYFIADSEADMNDWLAKLNYAATFRTAGVRMRGVVGGTNDGQRARRMRPVEGVPGSHYAHSVIIPAGEVSIIRGGIDVKLAAEIAAARREVVKQRIFDSEDKIAVANKDLQNYLRNGRHLTILTPIQPRTREQVVMAAATLAAKLQWVRMEMWKLRCHRDILALDLEEERRATKENVQMDLITTTPNLIIPASSIPSTSESSTLDTGSGGQTPSQESYPQSSEQPHQAMTYTPHAPSRNKIPSGDHSGSIMMEPKGRESGLSGIPVSPSSSVRGQGWDDRSVGTSRSYHSTSPARSQSSVAASVDYDRDGEDDKDSGKDNDKIKRKEKEKEGSRPSVRRSLQRTLRETQSISHRRAKSYSDDASTFEKSKVEDEGLARAAGSFTVHGKKASVITFGSEWQNMSPEDRLKRHKYTQADLEYGTNMGAEGNPNTIGHSRRGSQAAVANMRDEDLEMCLQPALPNSTKGNYSTEDLSEGPESSTIQKEFLLKLKRMKADESN